MQRVFDGGALILKGILFGIANVIPGVSGGSVALLLGVYDRLMEAIGGFLLEPQRWKSYLGFLFLFGAGIVLGVLAFSKVMLMLLGDGGAHPPLTYIPTYAVIVGLIVGTIPAFLRMVHIQWNLVALFMFLLGVITVFLLGFVLAAEASQDIQYVIREIAGFRITNISLFRATRLVVVGFISAVTMLLPGISGSAMLLAMGEYQNILYYIDGRFIIPLGFIAVGGVAGLILAAKGIHYALSRFPSVTAAFLFGLLVASTVQIVQRCLPAWDAFQRQLGSAWLAYGIIGISCVAPACVSYILSKRLSQ